jgi:uncharacterized protein (TIGR03435 family)
LRHRVTTIAQVVSGFRIVGHARLPNRFDEGGLMTRAVFTMIAFFLMASLATNNVRAQQNAGAAAGGRSFDVASIRESEGTGGTFGFRPGRLTIDNVQLSFIIELAHGLRPRMYELVDVPDWVSATKYTISATYSGPRASSEEEWAMLRRLLEDRFGLRSHRETRQGRIYVLSVARSDRRLGPRLVSSGIDCDKWRVESQAARAAGKSGLVAPAGKRPCSGIINNGGLLSGDSVSIQQLARALESSVQAPVIDGTELLGLFDVRADYTPESELTGPTPPGGVSVFTAVQEQLGLRLQPNRGPIEVMVIDSIKRPTPN